MVKNKYSWKKRQKELAKKKMKEEKRQSKLEKKKDPSPSPLTQDLTE